MLLLTFVILDRPTITTQVLLSVTLIINIPGDRERLGKMISSLSKAWKLVHDKLPDHAFGN